MKMEGSKHHCYSQKGDKHISENNCPISLKSIICKVVESEIKKPLLGFLGKRMFYQINNLVSYQGDQQPYSFRQMDRGFR